jgi:hypothetical protein
MVCSRTSHQTGGGMSRCLVAIFCESQTCHDRTRHRQISEISLLRFRIFLHSCFPQLYSSFVISRVIPPRDDATHDSAYHATDRVPTAHSQAAECAAGDTEAECYGSGCFAALARTGRGGQG